MIYPLNLSPPPPPPPPTPSPPLQWHYSLTLLPELLNEAVSVQMILWDGVAPRGLKRKKSVPPLTWPQLWFASNLLFRI